MQRRFWRAVNWVADWVLLKAQVPGINPTFKAVQAVAINDDALPESRSITRDRTQATQQVAVAGKRLRAGEAGVGSFEVTAVEYFLAGGGDAQVEAQEAADYVIVGIKVVADKLVKSLVADVEANQAIGGLIGTGDEGDGDGPLQSDVAVPGRIAGVKLADIEKDGNVVYGRTVFFRPAHDQVLGVPVDPDHFGGAGDLDGGDQAGGRYSVGLPGSLDGEADAVATFEGQIAVVNGVEDIGRGGEDAIFAVEVELLGGVDPFQLGAFAAARILQDDGGVVLTVVDRVGDSGVGLGVAACLEEGLFYADEVALVFGIEESVGYGEVLVIAFEGEVVAAGGEGQEGAG